MDSSVFAMLFASFALAGTVIAALAYFIPEIIVMEVLDNSNDFKFGPTTYSEISDCLQTFCSSDRSKETVGTDSLVGVGPWLNQIIEDVAPMGEPVAGLSKE